MLARQFLNRKDMQLEVELERHAQIHLNPDKVNKSLEAISQLATRW